MLSTLGDLLGGEVDKKKGKNEKNECLFTSNTVFPACRPRIYIYIYIYIYVHVCMYVRARVYMYNTKTSSA
jgi:hypothetical protein